MSILEQNTICKQAKLIDLVKMINRIELRSYVKSVEVIEEGSISVDFINQKTIEVLSTENACFLPAHAFLMSDIIEDEDSLSFPLLEYLKISFDKLNFRMVLFTEINSKHPIAYFITIIDGVVVGFLVKMQNEE